MLRLTLKAFYRHFGKEKFDVVLYVPPTCLLYTSDAADERSSVDLGGRRIIKNKNSDESRGTRVTIEKRHRSMRSIEVTRRRITGGTKEERDG